MAESSEDSFFKFPRTRHLFDAGGSGVSRDDLLMDSSEEKVFYTTRQHQVLVAVEEKVDGANLGVSIGHDMKLYVQNRAHYINSTTHRQFSTLDNWCATHSSELYDILIPGKHVLFGEWLYAKHSVHYKELPGYFIAFDVYDKEVSKFYSRRERNKMLENTSIPIIRLIEETNLVDRQQVRALLCNSCIIINRSRNSWRLGAIIMMDLVKDYI